MLRRVAMIVLLLAVVSLAAGGFALGDGEVFERQSLRNAQFSNCDLRGATFTSSDLTGIKLLEIPRSANISLRRSHLEDATLEYVRLNGAQIDRSSITGVRGYDLTLDDWNVRQSNWSKLTLQHCALRYITLDRSDVRDFRAEWGSVRGGRWSGTDLRESSFSNCDLSRSEFYRGSLERTRFQNVSFRDVRLENCDISGLVINGVRIDELLK